MALPLPVCRCPVGNADRPAAIESREASFDSAAGDDTTRTGRTASPAIVVARGATARIDIGTTHQPKKPSIRLDDTKKQHFVIAA